MKKWLIFLISLFNILIGINSVSAEELKYDQTKPFEHLTMTNTIDLSDEEVTTLMKKANYTDEYITKYLLRRNYALQNNKSGKYYFVNPGNIYNLASDRIFINLSSENIKQGWIEISNSRDGASTDIYYNIESNDGYTYYTYDYSTTPSTSSSKWFASNNILFQFTYNSNNVIYNGYNSMCLSYFYETNMKGQLSYKKGAFGGTSDIIVDDITYSINSMLPITIEDGYHSLKDTKPKLTYKTGFTSSEAYSVLGKVSVDYSLVDNVDIYKNNWQQVKLQFGANDFKKGNIPVFSHFKLYGRYNSSDTWKSADDYIDKGYIDIQIVDTTYDYSEGMLADASITLQVNYNFTDENEGNIEELLYHYYKLEFYLDNTQNGFIYCYDNLNNSKWEDTAKFLEDYIYYYFPTNYKYAFITSEKNQNDGKIYFPTNSVNNDLIKLQGQYYNLSNKTFSRSIPNFIYDQDDYYSYFEFSFNDSQNILVMNRILGSVTYENWYNSAFLEGWNFLTGPLYWGTLTSVSENSYFYAPIGYNVYFTNDTNIKVITSQGEITIDIENSKNDYESKADNNTTSNIFNIFSNESNLVAQVFKPFLEIWNASKTYVGIFNYILIVIIGSIIILLLKSKK